MVDMSMVVWHSRVETTGFMAWGLHRYGLYDKERVLEFQKIVWTYHYEIYTEHADNYDVANEAIVSLMMRYMYGLPHPDDYDVYPDKYMVMELCCNPWYYYWWMYDEILDPIFSKRR